MSPANARSIAARTSIETAEAIKIDDLAAIAPVWPGKGLGRERPEAAHARDNPS